MDNKVKKSGLILNLFFTMLKIGLFTFGGGYAMIALLQNEFVEKKKYIDKDEFVLPMLPPGGSIDDIITKIGEEKNGK